MKSISYTLIVFVISLYSCIGDDFIDDFVPPRIEISNPIDSLKIGDSHLYKFWYFNNVGNLDTTIEVSWKSLSPSVVSITDSGLATAALEGSASIVVSTLASPILSDTVQVMANTLGTSEPPLPIIRTGTLQSTSSYLLAGDFELLEDTGDIKLRLKSNFKASSDLPGLYVYLTNNPSTNNGAVEISRITQFTGEQEFTVPNTTDINMYDYVLFYCKPFVVKVGDGAFDN